MMAEGVGAPQDTLGANKQQNTEAQCSALHDAQACGNAAHVPLRTYLQVQHDLERGLVSAERDGSCFVPTTRADAMAALRMLKSDYLVSPFKGLYARRSSWVGLDTSQQTLHIMRGITRLHPAWIFRSHSALLAWNIDVPHILQRPILIIAKRIPSDRSVLSARRLLARDRVVTVSGMPVTDIGQSLWESLSDLPFEYALAIADAAIRSGNLPTGTLTELLESERERQPIAQRPLFVASYACGAVESIGESRIRARCISEGYAMPELQVTITDPTDPHRTYRVDFLWRLPDGRLVIGEFDGEGKYFDPKIRTTRTAQEAMLRERQRESRLTIYGIPVLRFTNDELLRPARFRNLMDAAGIPRDPKAAKTWNAKWSAMV